MRETQELSKIGGWEYVVADKRMTWTAEAYRIYGVADDSDLNNIPQAIGFYAERDQQTVERAFNRAIQDGIPYDLELEFRAADGSRKWVRTMGRPEYAGDKLVKVVGNIMDITDRIQAEAVLSASEQNFRNLAENALDGIVIGAADGRHLYGNRRAAEILGYTPAELLQTTQKDLADPAAYPMLKQRLADRLAGRPLPSVYEALIRRKDGTSFSAEISGTRTMWQGQLCDLVFIRDITERQQAAEALRASEERFKSIVESSPLGMHMYELTPQGAVGVHRRQPRRGDPAWGGECSVHRQDDRGSLPAVGCNRSPSPLP